MSLSAEHRGPDHNHDDRPSFHDFEPSDDRKGARRERGEREEDPLVEHILDFLDKYPARFAPCSSLAGCMRAC